MEFDLLTYRLSHFMNQISDKQIAQLVEKDREEKEKLRQSSLMSCRNTPLADYSRDYKAIKHAMNFTKKKPELCNSMDGEKARPKKVELGTLWGVSNKFKDIAKKDASEVKPKRNAFIKAAKMAVLINHVKEGKVVCTCESLESKCAVHDDA